jgi:phosphoribosylamine--glycine ligase
MNVLVIGSGGREHALVWKLAQSPGVEKIFCAPGNAGIADQAQCVPIKPTDLETLAAFAANEKVGLTVVGPEAPLCAGIADLFQSRGLRIFGPNKAAARIEGSKVFCKRLLLKYKIPTAAAEIFSDAAEARAFVSRNRGRPMVVKADGLAAGKGVVVATSTEEAQQAVAAIMEKKVFGEAGREVVIEECLEGEEASVMALTDGKTVKVLAASQDHKRVFDGDQGPNTGGMGAYSPASVVNESNRSVIDGIFSRVLSGLHSEGIEYRGVLYAGLMLTANGPKVLEFNARLGDPETQVVVPRMDFDLLEAMQAAVDGRLADFEMAWRRQTAVCVVLASGGYPGEFEKGKEIRGLREAAQLDNVVLFHAGTRRDSGQSAVVTELLGKSTSTGCSFERISAIGRCAGGRWWSAAAPSDESDADYQRLRLRVRAGTHSTFLTLQPF